MGNIYTLNQHTIHTTIYLDLIQCIGHFSGINSIHGFVVAVSHMQTHHTYTLKHTHITLEITQGRLRVTPVFDQMAPPINICLFFVESTPLQKPPCVVTSGETPGISVLKVFMLLCNYRN